MKQWQGKKEEQRFSKGELLKSKTLGFSEDLKKAVLSLEKRYTKKEAQQAIEQYLNKTMIERGN